MMARIRASRHGLTRCAHCGRHARVAAACSFCGGALGVASGSAISLGARGGLIAAALLGSPLAACDEPGHSDGGVITRADADVGTTSETTTSEDTTVTNDVPDVVMQDIYGAPPDSVVEVIEDDVPVQPLYGEPPREE